MASKLNGLAEMRATLVRMGAASTRDRIGKSVLSAGATVAVKEIKKEAPHGATGETARSIGKQFEKRSKDGILRERVGITSQNDNRPHAHLVALGSRPRRRKRIGGRFGYIKNPTTKQLSTGTMPANHFVRDGFNKSRSAALAAMQKRFEKKLADELAKARS